MSIPVYTDKGRQYKGKEQPSNPASITANSGSDLENISTVTVNYLLEIFFLFTICGLRRPALLYLGLLPGIKNNQD